MRNLLIIFFISTALGTYGQSDQIQSTFTFPSNQYQLEEKDKQNIQALVNKLQDFHDFDIQIIGHADSQGQDAYNEALSKKRAEAVAHYLLQQQVSKDKIQTTFWGESKPVQSNQTAQGRRANRRVELIIHYTLALSTNSPNPSTIADLYAQTRHKAQRFLIDPSMDTTLITSRGTVLIVPANAFRDVNPHQFISVQVKEFLTKSEMVLEHLSTTTDKSILETQGMVQITASQSGKALSEHLAKEIDVMIPTNQFREDVQLFDGHRAGADSLMIWAADEEAENIRFLNWSNFRNGWSTGGFLRNCPFFFCGMGNFFAKTFGNEEKRQAKQIQARTSQVNSLPDNYQLLKDMVEKHGIENTESLVNTIEDKFQDIEFDELKFYVFNTRKLGWINVDAFMSFPRKQLTTMKVNLKPAQDVDVKLVFQNRKVILPPKYELNDQYVFAGIPKGEVVWVVAIKYAYGKPYLSMTQTKISKKVCELDFREVTLSELQAALQKLDGNI